MLEIRDKVIEEMVEILKSTPKVIPPELCIKRILDISGIAIVDREAELPFPIITTRANDPRYQDGAIQHGMRLLLKAGWVKEVGK